MNVIKVIGKNQSLRALDRPSPLMDPVGYFWESTPDDTGLQSHLRQEKLSPKMLSPTRLSYAEIRLQASRESK